MLRVLDSAASPDDSPKSVIWRVAFPMSGQGRHAGVVISEVNTWPACTPVFCFTRDLTVAGARLGAKMVRYSFLVRLFHPRLHAGLSRRFPRPLFRSFTPVWRIRVVSAQVTIPVVSRVTHSRYPFRFCYRGLVTCLTCRS